MQFSEQALINKYIIIIIFNISLTSSNILNKKSDVV